MVYVVYEETARVFPDLVDYGVDIFMPCFLYWDSSSVNTGGLLKFFWIFHKMEGVNAVTVVIYGCIELIYAIYQWI